MVSLSLSAVHASHHSWARRGYTYVCFLYLGVFTSTAEARLSASTGGGGGVPRVWSSLVVLPEADVGGHCRHMAAGLSVSHSITGAVDA